jgi:hypothetical protein
MDASGNIAPNNVPYPPNLSPCFNIVGTSGCTYTAASSGPGSSNCPNFAKPVQCTADVGAGTEFDCEYLEEKETVVPKVLCEWP